MVRLPRDAGAAAPARTAAFTLVEVLVGLAIALALVAGATPSFRDWLAAYQLTNHARHLAESMTLARTEAVRRGHRVNLCATTDRQRCAERAGWNSGFLVFVDVNRNGQVDDDEPVLALDGPAPPGVTVQANRPLDEYVSYTSVGNARMLNGALQMGTFTVCRTGQLAMQVVLANSGRVRVDRSAGRCP